MYRITCASYKPADYLSIQKIQEGKLVLEDVPGLPTDPDDYYEDTDSIVDKYK